MERSPRCEKDGLNKGPWTPEEDQKLLAYIEQHGHGCWRSLPARAGLQRCRKSCRLRWTNYLRPDIKRGKFSLQEEQTIIRLHALMGNRWSAIATHLPNRTNIAIKNYWNKHLKKRLAKMGIDPVTHKPRSDALGTVGAGSNGGGGAGGQLHAETAARLSHTAQWESARLEAQARMAHAREASRLRAVAASASVVSARRRTCPDTPPTSMFYSENAAMPTQQSMQQQQAREEAARNKDHVELQQWGDQFIDASYADCAAKEFAAMLLDESLHQQQTENEKEYWLGIMHLVNKPMPTPPFEASSSSAPLQTSVAMAPAPEAYSSSTAASSSTSVTAPPPGA